MWCVEISRLKFTVDGASCVFTHMNFLIFSMVNKFGIFKMYGW